jgi:hypothetical protein
MTFAPREKQRRKHASRASVMLYLLLFIAALVIAFVWQTRRLFHQRVPSFRYDRQSGGLQVRRYPKLAVAEVRVTGASASTAMKSGTQQLDRYFREGQISRFAMPLLAEKVDAADAIWNMSAVLPMPLEAAPSPRNKSIQLKELAPHRAFARLHHGAVPDGLLTRQKAEMLPLVNNLCREMGCTKLSTVIVMHRFPWWVPSLFRVSDLMVRVTDDNNGLA